MMAAVFTEQEKRDSWPRAWKWLKQFGDYDPRTIEPEHFLRIDPVTGEPRGLVPEIEAKVSVTERHMVIKVWRGSIGATRRRTSGTRRPSRAIRSGIAARSTSLCRPRGVTNITALPH